MDAARFTHLQRQLVGLPGDPGADDPDRERILARRAAAETAAAALRDDLMRRARKYRIRAKGGFHATPDELSSIVDGVLLVLMTEHFTVDDLSALAEGDAEHGLHRLLQKLIMREVRNEFRLRDRTAPPPGPPSDGEPGSRSSLDRLSAEDDPADSLAEVLDARAWIEFAPRFRTALDQAFGAEDAARVYPTLAVLLSDEWSDAAWEQAVRSDDARPPLSREWVEDCYQFAEDVMLRNILAVAGEHGLDPGLGVRLLERLLLEVCSMTELDSDR